MDVGQLHERCVNEFLQRLGRVRDDQWDRPTPCRDWTVRDLVNHMVNEELWTVPLMAGQRIADIGDRFDGDLLGTDPVGSAERAARQAQAAALEPVRVDRTVHLSFGDVPASEYAMQLSADHLIHGWDLAVSTGTGERLPAELVEALVEWFAERETPYRQSGAIGERPHADDRGDPQRRLLIAFGRDPDWAPRGQA